MPPSDHQIPMYQRISVQIDRETGGFMRLSTSFASQLLAPTVQSSRAEVWDLKEITFRYGSRRIITQNSNGPCSFIAICNILILRGQIEILPPNREKVSYEYLSQLLGEDLLSVAGNVDISAALSAMPSTQRGMDLNPIFTGPTLFRPSSHGGELELFKLAKIKLVHGWLVDPQSPEAPAVMKVEDYDAAVDLLAAADHITMTRSAVGRDNAQVASSSKADSTMLSSEDQAIVEDAIIVGQFLGATRTELTYHGLFELARIIEPGQLVALYRSSHLSVVYKPPNDDALYSLVTEHSFLREPTVVWRRLDDVDVSSAPYVDSDFKPSSPAGGDVLGQTAYEVLLATQYMSDPQAQVDKELAMQLQFEEDNTFRERRTMYYKRQQERRQYAEHKAAKKGKTCIIM
ncbi:MINDY deubiquitinase [Pleurotus pulmonarius]